MKATENLRLSTRLLALLEWKALESISMEISEVSLPFFQLLDSIKQNTDENKDSSLVFYLEPGMHLIELGLESISPRGGSNMQAQVLISNISITGSNHGGAIDCK